MFSTLVVPKPQIVIRAVATQVVSFTRVLVSRWIVMTVQCDTCAQYRHTISVSMGNKDFEPLSADLGKVAVRLFWFTQFLSGCYECASIQKPYFRSVWTLPCCHSFPDSWSTRSYSLDVPNLFLRKEHSKQSSYAQKTCIFVCQCLCSYRQRIPSKWTSYSVTPKHIIRAQVCVQICRVYIKQSTCAPCVVCMQCLSLTAKTGMSAMICASAHMRLM